MHKQMDLTLLGGLYAYQDTLRYMQEGYGGALDALAAGMGTRFVLSGCEDSGSAVANGWVIIDGVIMPFVGGSKPATPQVKVNEVVTKELFDDGQQKDVYYTKFASLVSIGDFAYSALQRLPGNKGILQSLLDVQQLVRAIGVEPAVIMEGCTVSAVDVGASTLAISAGKALIDGVWLTVPAFSGTYPVYLTNEGSWTNTIPAGTHVRFNPHTSQRYADVLRRATTPVGEIKMMRTLSDRFDNTGLGRWEMLGFRLSTTLQARTPVGLWWNGIAQPGVTDTAFATAENSGGVKEVTLTEAQLPSIDIEADGSIGGNAIDHNNTTRIAGGSTAGGTTPLVLASIGGGEAHSNMQPYRVVVMIERI